MLFQWRCQDRLPSPTWNNVLFQWRCQDRLPSPTSNNALFQWRSCHPSVFVVYRCVVAIYFVTWIILSGVLEYGWTVSDDQRIKWFIYLTNWSYFLLTVSVLLQAAVVGAAYCKGGAFGATTSTSSYNVTQGFFHFLFLSVQPEARQRFGSAASARLGSQARGK